MEQDGLAPSTGGRRAAQFVPNPNQLPFILSVAIDQFYTSVAVIDFKNQFKSPINTESIDIKQDGSFQMVIELIKRTIKEIDVNQIYGIGVTIPGFCGQQNWPQ
ncbi:hypothetical protein [Sphingobacterium daejeonense]|uniref:hypothetical protein n=1 Tax=Sphingobacterium daejeonense TaxID=371142 RepID=UPI0010FE28DD|nr:hypothetical protein [Sphingobacterium daejeonense]